MFPPRTRGDLGRDIGLPLAKAIDVVVRLLARFENEDSY
jgi:hypothetical protein